MMRTCSKLKFLLHTANSRNQYTARTVKGQR